MNMTESGLQSAPEATPTRTADVFRAAAKLMVEKGYGGTSIGDIAQAVGMTKAGLYHHISGKQDMLYQILNHALDGLDRNIITPVRLIEDPEERLRQLIRLHTQCAIENGLTFTGLMSEINHLAAEQQKTIRARIEQYRMLIRETLRELDAGGRLRSLDTDIATMHIMKTLTGVAHWKHQDFASDTEHLIQETIAYTMAALLKSES